MENVKNEKWLTFFIKNVSTISMNLCVKYRDWSYWTDEFTDDYRDFIMDLVGQAKQHCKDPVTLIEQYLDFFCNVPDGFGTGDFLLVADKKLNLVDFKYGRGVAVYADHNPQMMLYALGALNLFDCLAICRC